jgi:UDP-N-acetylglucosamine acyltransferase
MSAIANIHPKAIIGGNTIIEPFATIGEDVEIGENCWIGPNAVLMSGTRVGNNCKVFPGAVIGAIPQDLKYKGENTRVYIGDNTTIREHVTINKGTADKNKTSVGKNCLIMAYVHIAHDCIVGDHCIIANGVTLAGHIRIDDFAILEGLVAVQQFVHIGAHSFIAGASLVRKNVPPYVKAAREPLAYIGINSVGLKRRGYTADDVSTIENIYKQIYILNKNVSEGMSKVKASVADGKLKSEIMDFINSSEKGVIRSSLS